MPQFLPNIAVQVAELKRQVRDLQRRALPDWTDLMPSGSMVTWGAPYDSVLYYVTRDREVVLTGTGKTTAAIAAGGTLFTLPADVPNPPTRKPFVVASTAGIIRMDIDAAGVVIAMTALTSGSYVTFENVRYRY